MPDSSNEAECLHCAKSERVVPILTLRYRGEEIRLCSACLPILLHRPGKLAGRLKGAEDILPASHSHS